MNENYKILERIASEIASAETNSVEDRCYILGLKRAVSLIHKASGLYLEPLSPEVFRAFGFSSIKATACSECWILGNTLVVHRTEGLDENYYHFYYEIADGNAREIRLDYVHQLENLATTLTNKQLIRRECK